MGGRVLADDGPVAPAGPQRRPTVRLTAGGLAAFGTNLLAWAAPRAAGRSPIVMDWATAAMAEGTAVAIARGEEVPEGVLVRRDDRVDARARATTDRAPADICRSLKGSELSLLIEMDNDAHD